MMGRLARRSSILETAFALVLAGSTAGCEKPTAPPLTATASPSATAVVDPDGPAPVLASDAEAKIAYDRAVSEYKAGKWVDAGELARSVGAHGGSLAADGYVLAARCAGRAGDGQRASRMWARAHTAACPTPSSCVVRAPKDDLFARAAQHPGYAPWYGPDLCARAVRSKSIIVGGNQQITAIPDGYEVREVPSRVLLERILPPPDSILLCWSRDGQERVAAVSKSNATLYFSASGASWTPLPLPEGMFPDTLAYLDTEGHALFPIVNNTPDSETVSFVLVDPKTSTARGLALSPPPSSPFANLGPAGTLYTAFAVPRGPGKGFVMGLVRYDVTNDKGTVLIEASSEADVGPVDDKGRVLVQITDNQTGERLLWVEGSTGKKLADIPKPPGMESDGFGWLGVVPPSTVVWEDRRVVRSVNVADGKIRIDGVVWHPIDGNVGPDIAEVTRILGALPSGPSGKPWSSFAGWHVDGVDREDLATVRVAAAGRRDLAVVVSADKKGAFVMSADGRFEMIGDVSAPFRASASCGENTPSVRALPLEVCAVTLEQAGLTAAWLASK